MALSQNIEVKTENAGYTVPYLANAEDVFYKGALVDILTSAGKIVVAGDTASHVFAGYVAEYVSAAAGDTVKVVRSDRAWFSVSSAAQTDIGKFVYATADDTLSTSTATNVLPAGLIVDVDLVNDEWLVDFAKGNVVVIDTTGA